MMDSSVSKARASFQPADVGCRKQTMITAGIATGPNCSRTNHGQVGSSIQLTHFEIPRQFLSLNNNMDYP
jgi:hypothetical protein